MTPLREKMIRAMELRNLSSHTQRSYLSSVAGLANHYNKSPDQLETKTQKGQQRKEKDVKFCRISEAN
jgi:hypothetical protein